MSKQAPEQGFVLSGPLYDKIKFVAQVVLPATATLYATLSVIWGFPNSEQVVLTITAIDTFLGVVLMLSNKGYKTLPRVYDGEMVVDKGPGGLVYHLNVEGDLLDLPNKDEIRLKVNPKTEAP